MHCANSVIENNKNRNNKCLIYGSREIDSFLAKAGGLAFSQNRTTILTNYDENLAVHIATELYLVRGHSGALKDLIRALPDKRHVILITNLLERLTDL